MMVVFISDLARYRSHVKVARPRSDPSYKLPHKLQPQFIDEAQCRLPTYFDMFHDWDQVSFLLLAIAMILIFVHHFNPEPGAHEISPVLLDKSSSPSAGGIIPTNC